MERLRKKIRDKISCLKNEYYKYYEQEEISTDDQLIREEIFREIELLEWVLEESYLTN